MKKTRQNGFVLILVIVSIAIIGLVMSVLTNGANTMMFQSDTAYLKACERNLIASGLAWAKRNIQNNSRENFDKTIELDVSKMDIRGSSLIVTIMIPADKKPQAKVNTSCSRGRRTFRGDGEYKIRL
jgi:type II secretory pathway pseudopilin PulG